MIIVLNENFGDGDYKPNVTVWRLFNRGLVKTAINGDCRGNVTVWEVTVGERDCIFNLLTFFLNPAIFSIRDQFE